MRLIAAALLCAAVIPAADPYTYATNPASPYFGINMSPSSQGGVLVNSVFPGSAAAQSGVQPGDSIVSVNGSPIESMTDMRNEISLYQAGDNIVVDVLTADGQHLQRGGTLTPWPESLPRDPIDAAAEKRYRDWLDRRGNQASNRAAQLADSVKEREQARRAQLAAAKAANDPRQLPLDGFADADIMRGMPAWSFTARLGEPLQPLPRTTRTLASSEVPAWQFTWVTPTTAATSSASL